MALLTDQSDESSFMDTAASREFMRKLVHEEYEVVYRFAYRLSGSRADADDLTQQTFLQACRKLDQLRSGERARSWLLTIARNCFLKLRQRDRRWETPGDEQTWIQEDSSAWPEEFDEEQLQQALQEMPEIFRTPVLLYYFDGMSYQEMSRLLDVPIGTIMSRLARGKEALRSRLLSPRPVAAGVDVPPTP
jgi:RNA polymerase sigma-70 factor (ECF subfamily)